MTNRTELFYDEALEQLREIESLVLSVEQKATPPDNSTINALFRSIHTIKGGADFLGLNDVKTLSHETETFLEHVKNGQASLNSTATSTLLRVVDALNGLIEPSQRSTDFHLSDLVESLQAITGTLHETPRQSTAAAAPLDTHEGQDPAATRSSTLDERDTGFNHFAILVAEANEKDMIAEIGEIGISVQQTSIDGHNTTGPRRYEFRSVLPPALCARFLGVDPASIEVIGPNPDDDSYPDGSLDVVTPDTISDSDAFLHDNNDLAMSTGISPDPQIGVVGGASKETGQGSSIRVNVDLLDSLMNLAGELVLTRNQMNQVVSLGDPNAMVVAAQRLDAVTTELQASIMSTRMQPISVILTKFNRVCRDLAAQLGKKVMFTTEGDKVELDKSIIESIADPLTHLVRNAIDHGLETIAERERQGKPPFGRLTIHARHEAGHVLIDVADDGRGINTAKIRDKALRLGLLDRSKLDDMSEKELLRFIFAPGFTTAERVSDVSGRGVGMDVVSTNLARLGGSIDVETKQGEGTRFKLKLPLTLAIVPSLLISVKAETYAIPQVNLVELLRFGPGEHQHINAVGDQFVVQLRDRLLPIIWLGEYLGIDEPGTTLSRLSGESVHIVVVSAGEHEYGLAVDNLMDSEEIVVKPLGAHLRNCHGYAGATILGDGQTALILDIAGIAESTIDHRHDVKDASTQVVSNRLDADAGDSQKLILIENAEGEFFCVPLGAVNRIERVDASSIEQRGSRSIIKYNNSVLRVFELTDSIETGRRPQQPTCFLLIFHVNATPLSVAVANIVDIVDANSSIDTLTFRQPGVSGSAIILSNITLMLDLVELVSTIEPDLGMSRELHGSNLPSVLIAEDSVFFQDKLQQVISSIGLTPIIAEDGQSAWELLDADAQSIDLVLTDIEMPRMDGLTLARAIRNDPRFSTMPIIMLTSLARETDVAAGKHAGADDYLIKMDPEAVKQSVLRHLDPSARQRSEAHS